MPGRSWRPRVRRRRARRRLRRRRPEPRVTAASRPPSGKSACSRISARAAARLLGSLQIPQSLPLLKDIIQNDDDVLLRRAAAVGLRQLQTPESIPVMEHILANAGDDRFVRLSAAYGLAESGRPLGVTGLAQIFQESSADGRGRDMAFRALTSLNDERPLPFMRQVVASEAEPSYRLRAIQYLTAQGDRQSLPTLQLLLQPP